MKKIFGIALVLAVLAVLSFGSVALADDPDTIVTIDWGPGTGGPGSGWIGTTVTAGDDATAFFQTDGSVIAGSFILTDSNDEPYGYTVDTVDCYLDAVVLASSSAYIEYAFDRYDDKYGAGEAGEWSYAYVEVSGEGSSGAMALGSTSNYEVLTDFLYTDPTTPGGHHLEANANGYELIRKVGMGNGDLAYVWGFGSGTATIDCTLSSANTGGASWQAPSLSLGSGASYNTEYHATATAPSYFELYASGSTSTTLYDVNTTVVGGTTGGLTWLGNPVWTGSSLTATGTGTPTSCGAMMWQNFNTSFDMNNFTASSN